MTARSLQTLPKAAPLVPRGIEVIAMDRDHAKAVAFNMLFVTWRYHTHANAVKPCFDILARLEQRYPEGVGVCHVVESDAIPPTAAARKLIAEVLRLPILKHYSATHEGAGFKAASIRAVVAGIHTLSRASCEHSVHSSFSRAAEWHARRQAALGRSETAAQINAAFETLRARHRQQYP
jgi:hypothetical protein